MLEADKALLERTQNALDQCLAWLERMRSSTHMSCTPSCQLRRCWSTRCGTSGAMRTPPLSATTARDKRRVPEPAGRRHTYLRKSWRGLTWGSTTANRCCPSS